MSYDLLVVTRMRPAPDSLEAFARAGDIPVLFTGQFRVGANVLVANLDEDGRTIDVDGPSRIESTDLDDVIAGSVRSPRWQVEIHLPGGFDDAVDQWVVDLAIHVARTGDGVVYDPQQEAIIWPTGITPRARGSTEERIRTIQLEWIIPWSRVPEDMPTRWLAVLRDLLPVALPTRFGTYEPFQGRLGPDGDGAFVAAWRSVEEKAWGGLLFSKGSRPCFSGTIQIPDRRGEQIPCLSVDVTLDARPYHRDPGSADDLVLALPSICGRIGAIYADATVRRNWILRRGSLWSDELTEDWSSPLRRGALFGGLPAIRPWAAWYGPEYVPLVRSTFANVAADLVGGMLVRHGRLPMDRDELADTPRVPFDLIGPVARTVPPIE